MNSEEKKTSRPKPEARVEQFESLAYGMFIHYGLYSQLEKGEWIMNQQPIAIDEYRKLKDTFTAEQFEARAIAKIAKQAGMKYITLTTRHSDGFSLYDTRGITDFDAPHSAAKRDLVAEFVEGCRAENIVPFLYHTTLDWRRETETCDEKKFNEYLDYLHDSVEVLCKHYGPIGGLWFDGNWSRPDANWKLDRLYGMIRKYQPEAMIIDNTGMEHRGEVSHPEIDSVTFEQGMPKPLDRKGHAKYVAGEMCQTLNMHWGIAGLDFNYKSVADIIKSLTDSRKAGANLLLNVGPKASGQIGELEAAMLKRVGKWVKIHAEPIYNGKPVDVSCFEDDFILEANDKWYYFVSNLRIAGHENVTLNVGLTNPRTIKGVNRRIKGIRWIDNNESLNFAQNENNGLLAIDLTCYPYGSDLVVRVAEIEF